MKETEGKLLVSELERCLGMPTVLCKMVADNLELKSRWDTVNEEKVHNGQELKLNSNGKYLAVGNPNSVCLMGTAGLSPKKNFHTIDVWRFSPDGEYFVYVDPYNSRGEWNLKMYHMDTDKTLSSGLYHSEEPPTLLGCRERDLVLLFPDNELMIFELDYGKIKMKGRVVLSHAEGVKISDMTSSSDGCLLLLAETRIFKLGADYVHDPDQDILLVYSDRLLFDGGYTDFLGSRCKIEVHQTIYYVGWRQYKPKGLSFTDSRYRHPVTSEITGFMFSKRQGRYIIQGDEFDDDYNFSQTLWIDHQNCVVYRKHKGRFIVTNLTLSFFVE